jgi:hypothetical protein
MEGACHEVLTFPAPCPRACPREDAKVKPLQRIRNWQFRIPGPTLSRVRPDFGGNGTAVAASANVVATGIAGRTGHPISFWQFTRYGIVVTVLSTTLAWVYVWFRYFL